MQLTFILGPAGSGKTWRCISEIRDRLRGSQDGPPLIFLAPKQATFQLERLLLSNPSLPGYSRLHILSFERFASFLLAALNQPPPDVLGEDGVSMVLRAILLRHSHRLQTFHAAARMAGFATQLRHLLAEFHQHQISPEKLRIAAQRCHDSPALQAKLDDLALLQELYAQWLNDHQLKDNASLVSRAAETLHAVAPPDQALAWSATQHPPLIEGLWLDGFANITPHELDLLAAAAPLCAQLNLAFCLDLPASVPTHPTPPSNPLPPAIDHTSWLSPWFVISQTFQRCHARLASLPHQPIPPTVVSLPRSHGRFSRNPALAQIEASWMTPTVTPNLPPSDSSDAAVSPFPNALRLIECPTPEAEAIAAARRILVHVRSGGRFRETAIIVRALDQHHALIRRVFARYNIPFFLDQREPIAHHPLIELIRYSLRCAALGCPNEDWFGWIKTGLLPIDVSQADQLQTEAVARGWEGLDWFNPLQAPSSPLVLEWAEPLRQQLIAPILTFIATLNPHPVSFENLLLQISTPPVSVTPPPLPDRIPGSALVDAWQQLLTNLDVESMLRHWSDLTTTSSPPSTNSVHLTALNELRSWLHHFDLAFANESLPPREWLPIIEIGLASLSAGVIPPVIDQVLVGAVDRSRNPDLKIAILLGMNEGIFPSPPPAPGLLGESDRERLETHGVYFESGRYRHIATERYLGYIACTRAREELMVCWSAQTRDGSPLAPSPFVQTLRSISPQTRIESFSPDAIESEPVHINELIPSLIRSEFLQASLAPSAAYPDLKAKNLPPLHLPDVHHLNAAWIPILLGSTLRSSVSRLEDFGACSFKFWMRSTLRVDEPRRFELDPRERGSFQHEVLSEFHLELVHDGLLWRDITPADAERRVEAIATRLLPSFRDGMLNKTTENQFKTRTLISSLKAFVAQIVAWMKSYQLNPVAVELGFGGPTDTLPAWKLHLDGTHALELQGRVDRIDALPNTTNTAAAVAIVDYKSSSREMDDLLLRHGIQIQLPAYLAALSQTPGVQAIVGAPFVQPVGLFYANLRPRLPAAANRTESHTLDLQSQAEAFAFQGRFRHDALELLDRDFKSQPSGQFRYRLKRDGTPYANERQLLHPEAFLELLKTVEATLITTGKAIFSGEIAVNPFIKGTEMACDFCLFASVCRIDHWTHNHYRVLAPCPE